ncbi:MAG: aminotransferase class I/II-fold pyridoxal phosphate-dependent enzyme [Brachybacterium sp.]|uniref:DegT/DnrJ/EryC1/StrS family aminotransferase n=1 Tax=Brachybacterium sp. TaxID=1891286 RepID=UPI0026486B4A|nr:aminotransferase class I/II-fold pyridoxal phosphate-dependent enzyme [Brachybacterium sp.]MDN5686084.1 aminotransferase class I/II-fold pyridoxal phosphate-dependent enzyme [Brachybacterium sp.]
MTPILLSGPDMSDAERVAVTDAFDSGWIAPLGPAVDAFEQRMADRLDRQHAVALSSGTAALHLGLLAWGVGPGDVVPTATMTFAATANAITYTGATPYFIDADPETGQIDPALLEEVLDDLHRQGRSVPAIVPVDLLGRCVDYTRIDQIARRYGVRVLADSAESLGASHAGIPAGKHGDAAILSFNGNKVMTTSGGGMYLTDDEDDAARVRFLATQAREPVAHYEHREVGYNYRLSNLLAGVGLAQLGRLDGMLQRRRARREAYAALVDEAPGIEVFQRDGDEHDNCWLTALVIDPGVAGFDAAGLAETLVAAGIECRPLWKPMHLQPVFAGAPARITGAAERLFRTGVTVPSGSGLTDEEGARVDALLADAMSAPARSTDAHSVRASS